VSYIKRTGRLGIDHDKHERRPSWASARSLKLWWIHYPDKFRRDSTLKCPIPSFPEIPAWCGWLWVCQNLKRTFLRRGHSRPPWEALLRSLKTINDAMIIFLLSYWTSKSFVIIAHLSNASIPSDQAHMQLNLQENTNMLCNLIRSGALWVLTISSDVPHVWNLGQDSQA
jgi:hypothetical protein